jgi:hypothetical protein
VNFVFVRKNNSDSSGDTKDGVEYGVNCSATGVSFDSQESFSTATIFTPTVEFLATSFRRCDFNYCKQRDHSLEILQI